MEILRSFFQFLIETKRLSMINPVGMSKTPDKLEGLFTWIQTFAHGGYSLDNLLGRYLHRPLRL